MMMLLELQKVSGGQADKHENWGGGGGHRLTSARKLRKQGIGQQQSRQCV